MKNRLFATSFSGSGAALTDLPAAISLNITSNNSTNQTYYPLFAISSSGEHGAQSDSALSYNPSTDSLSAGNFVGNGGGLTNLVAVSSSIINQNLTGVIDYPLLFAASSSGIQEIEADTSLSYNPSSDTLTAGYFVGDGTNITNVPNTHTAEAITGSFAGGGATLISGSHLSTGSFGVLDVGGGRWTSASLAAGGTAPVVLANPGGSGTSLSTISISGTTYEVSGSGYVTGTVGVSNDTNTNSTRYLTFTNTYYSSGQTVYGDEHLSYNPSTNTLTAGTFSGTSTLASRANKIDITAKRC